MIANTTHVYVIKSVLDHWPIESVTYFSNYATDDLATDLATASGYTISFRDYDWGLNSSH